MMSAMAGGVYRFCLVLFGVLCLAGSIAASAPAAELSDEVEIIDEDAPDCTEAVPAAYSTGHLTGPSSIDLAVFLVLNEVPEAEGLAVMAAAADAFAPIGLNLSVVGVAHVSFGHTTTSGGLPLGPDEPSIRSQELIDRTKSYLGGHRPDGSDVVYTLTGTPIADAAGRADCIGGARWSDQAFAVGEYQTGPSDEGDSERIAAHEISHLLGAHHHYMNCVEGNPPEAGEPDPILSACTLMAPDLSLVSLRLSVVEASVVRGHAEEYIAP